MGKKKSKRQKSKHSDNDVRIYRAHQIASVARTAFRVAGVVGVAYYAYQSIGVVAGKTTDFKAVVEFLAGLSINKWAAWLIAGICGSGWLLERRVRKSQIQRIHPRIKALEKDEWPDRTSSGIRENGGSPKE